MANEKDKEKQNKKSMKKSSCKNEHKCTCGTDGCCSNSADTSFDTSATIRDVPDAITPEKIILKDVENDALYEDLVKTLSMDDMLCLLKDYCSTSGKTFDDISTALSEEERHKNESLFLDMAEKVEDAIKIFMQTSTDSDEAKNNQIKDMFSKFTSVYLSSTLKNKIDAWKKAQKHKDEASVKTEDIKDCLRSTMQILCNLLDNPDLDTGYVTEVLSEIYNKSINPDELADKAEQDKDLTKMVDAWKQVQKKVEDEQAEKDRKFEAFVNEMLSLIERYPVLFLEFLQRAAESQAFLNTMLDDTIEDDDEEDEGTIGDMSFPLTHEYNGTRVYVDLNGARSDGTMDIEFTFKTSTANSYRQSSYIENFDINQPESDLFCEILDGLKRHFNN